MSKALELSQLANDVTYNEGTDTLSFGQANITVGTDVLLAYNDFSGDITVASNGAVTLATVNSNVGSFGSGSAIPVVTVNAKGLVTAVSTQAVNIVSTTDIAGDSGTDTITLGTDTLTFAGGTALTSTVTNNQVSIALDNTAVTAGSYGGSTAIPVITIDAQGRITAASTSSINTDLVSDTTPQLGGTLDANGNNIDMGTNLITDTKVGQWDTAYGWGDHGSAGYLTSIAADSINDTHIDFGTGTNQVSTADIPEQTNLYFTDARADARIAAADTDSLSEGSTNLYYTDARADARAQLKIDALVDSAPNTLDTLNELAAALGDDANFSTTITTSIASKLATADFTSTANTWIGTKSTSDLSEGTNLYYTNARADARIAAADTDALSEGATNLYFTNARADARIALQAGANLDLSSKTTSDLSEGTNLYYTNARVDAHLNQSNPTAGYVLSWNGSDYAWVADSDTVYTSFNTDFDTRLGTKTTANLTEGTNLYYTDARADARVNAQTGSNLDLSSKDTDNLSEGTTNLYYTDARVKASTLTGGSLRGTVNNATVQYATSYSGTPAQGSFFFDSLNQKLKVYTGSAFVDAVPAGGGGGGGSATDANTTFRKYTYTVTSSTNTLTGKDDIVVTAGSFITGYQYQIISVGNTDFTAIGASANTVGVTFTATGSGTGTGTAGHVLNYVTNGTENVEVYVNGVKQVEGSSYDYVATTGSSVAFISNLQIGDVADIQIYELLTNSAYYTQSQTYTQAETNTQISTAVSAYLPLAGGSMTGRPVLNYQNPEIRFEDSDTSNNGEITLDNTSLRIESDPDNAVANSTIKFMVDGTIRATIDSSGRLGLKTSANASFDQVAGANLFVLGSGAGDQGMTIYTGNTGTGSILFADGTTTSNQYEGYVQYDHANNAMLLGTNHATRMRIDSSGNVGIGTDTNLSNGEWHAGSKFLTIDGTDGDAYGVLSLRGDRDNTGTSRAFQIGAGDGKLFLAYDDNNNDHRVVVFPDGDVCVGQGASAAQAGNYGANLHVKSTSTGSSLKLTDSVTGHETTSGFEIITTNLHGYIWNREAGNLNFATSNVHRASIDSTGKMILGGEASEIGTNNVLTVSNNDNNAAYPAIALQNDSTGMGNGQGMWLGVIGTGSGLGRGYVWNYANKPIWIGQNGLTRINVSDQNGAIGFGNISTNEVSPSAWGTVFGAKSQWDTKGVIAATDGTMQIGHNWYYDDSAYKRIATGKANRLIFHDDYMSFESTVTSDSADTNITFSENFKLTDKGQLTINTPSIGAGNTGAGLSVQSVSDNSGAITARSKTYNNVFGVLPWSGGRTYLSSGGHYEDGTWKAQNTGGMALMSISGEHGLEWWAGNGSADNAYDTYNSSKKLATKYGLPVNNEQSYCTGWGSGARTDLTTTSWVTVNIAGTSSTGARNSGSSNVLEFTKIDADSDLIVSVHFPFYMPSAGSGIGIRLRIAPPGSNTYAVDQLTDGPGHGWGAGGYGGDTSDILNYTWNTENFLSNTGVGVVKMYFEMKCWSGSDSAYVNMYQNAYNKYGYIHVREVSRLHG